MTISIIPECTDLTVKMIPFQATYKEVLDFFVPVWKTGINCMQVKRFCSRIKEKKHLIKEQTK